jgi:hypothetical protein
MHTKFLLASFKGRVLRRHRPKPWDNIKTDLRKIGLENADWIHVA